MDETREAQEELAQDERDAQDFMREQDAEDWEAFHVDLRVRRPVRERDLPMADHE